MITLESLIRLFLRVKAYFIVILLQFGNAGMAIIAKMDIATVVTAPIAIVVERESRPRVTFTILLKAMLLGSFEPVLDQNPCYIGMTYTNSSFPSSMYNILPAVAFLMAWMFGVNIGELHSQAKILGTIVVVGGAINQYAYYQSSSAAANKHDLKKGAIPIITSCFSWSCFIILQACTLRSYPAKLSLTALICISGMVEAITVGLAFERGNNAAVWVIHFDYKLLACLYGGCWSCNSCDRPVSSSMG
ncbi:hypothetical protein I3760_02G181200 [Carya illinoinensis]|nr:hypothetical protein I3760_02G181200 [Carya illinoinensis]